MLYYFWSEVILLSSEGYMTRPASANDFPLKGILLPTQSLIPSRPKRAFAGAIKFGSRAGNTEIYLYFCLSL